MKKQSKLYLFLENSGALERGIEAEIKELKKKFWGIYKQEWKKAKMSKLKPFTVALNSKELKVITAAAQKHTLSCTRFIKEAALAYCGKQYLVLDAAQMLRIHEQITITYTAIEELLDGIGSEELVYEALLERIDTLEQEIHAALNRPKEIQTYGT